MKLLKTAAILAAGAAMAASTALTASAQTTTLRIQTHYAPETVSGKLAAQYIEDVTAMSNGEINVEMFYSSSVVKSVETFDAAATGILDCDMTGGGYQTGKNSAFQFVGDIMGGYDTPYQQLSWLYFGGGQLELLCVNGRQDTVDAFRRLLEALGDDGAAVGAEL